MRTGVVSIISPGLARVLVVSFASLTSFFLLTAVVPSYAASIGSGTVGAGLSTGVLMFATVGAEVATPWLARRIGYRAGLVAGLVLLGVPALALPYIRSLAVILAVSVIRGTGFAMVMVLGDALVPLLAPDGRRGEALGLAGVVASVPGVVALPLGVWLVARVGYPAVFLTGALAAVAAVAAVPRLAEPSVGRPAGPDGIESEAAGVLGGLRNRALLWPGIVFAATAAAGGIVATFGPLAFGRVAPAVLFTQAGTAAVARWWAGRRSDRRGGAELLMPAVVLSTLGVLALSWIGVPTILVAGAVMFGAGFGVAQSASMAAMFAAVPRAGYGVASALWNVAYDGGYGVGAVGYGTVVGASGYPVAFALTGALVLTALRPALAARVRRAPVAAAADRPTLCREAGP